MTGILYEGPSLLDGQPIVAIATSPKQSRLNPKTGEMMPVYILHQTIPPMEANRTGADAAICGKCPMKGTPHDRGQGLADGRICYVGLHFSVTKIWNAYRAGKYPRMATYQDRIECGRGQVIRIGAYGDGAAVPLDIWEDLLERAKNWTAYSHQVGNFPGLFMQSVESLADAKIQWRKGNRTFRVVGHAHEVDKAAEVLCPASLEGGKRTTCSTCNLCRGTSVRAKSIAVVAHGNGRTHFMRKMLKDAVDG